MPRLRSGTLSPWMGYVSPGRWMWDWGTCPVLGPGSPARGLWAKGRRCPGPRRSVSSEEGGEAGGPTARPGAVCSAGPLPAGLSDPGLAGPRGPRPEVLPCWAEGRWVGQSLDWGGRTLRGVDLRAPGRGPGRAPLPPRAPAFPLERGVTASASWRGPEGDLASPGALKCSADDRERNGASLASPREETAGTPTLRVTGRARPACPGRAASVASGRPAELAGAARGQRGSAGAGLRAGPATGYLSLRAGGDEHRCGRPAGSPAVGGAGRCFVFPVCRGLGSDSHLYRGPVPGPRAWEPRTPGLSSRAAAASSSLRPSGRREAGRPSPGSVWRAARGV